MTSARPSAKRHVSRAILAVVSALILVATVVGAGVTVVMGQLQGNITAVDISEQLGSAPPVAAITEVNEETGTFDPLNIVLMGSATMVLSGCRCGRLICGGATIMRRRYPGLRAGYAG